MSEKEPQTPPCCHLSGKNNEIGFSKTFHDESLMILWPIEMVLVSNSFARTG